MVTISILLILIFYVIILNSKINLNQEIILNEQNKNIDLKNQISNYQKEILILEKNIVELNQKIDIANSNWINLNNTNSNLSANLNNAEEIIIKKNEELLDYENKISSSMNWFRENSYLNTSIVSERKIEKETYGECVVEDEKSCNINLGCFYFVIDKKNQLKYKYDNALELGQEDKLSSILEFLENKGGDCEDYSLFYKAQFNSMVKRCENKSLILKSYSFKYGENKKRNFYLDIDKKWYIPNVYVNKFENLNYSYIVCGDMYDLNTDTINGHCMVAFSEEKIKSIEDISLLSYSILIEPQTGEYLGLLDDDSEIFILENGDAIDDYYNSIWAIISDDDYYLYDETQLKWYSYGSMKNKLEK